MGSPFGGAEDKGKSELSSAPTGHFIARKDEPVACVLLSVWGGLRGAFSSQAETVLAREPLTSVPACLGLRFLGPPSAEVEITLTLPKTPLRVAHPHGRGAVPSAVCT